MSGKQLTHLFFLDGLIDKERGPERRLLRHLDIHCQEMGGWTNERRRTCFASTAWVNSGENATCVMETSSRTRLNRNALLVKFSRTSRETYDDQPGLASKRGGRACSATVPFHVA